MMQNRTTTRVKVKVNCECKIGASEWLRGARSAEVGADIFADWGGRLNQTREKQMRQWQLLLAV